MKLAILAGALVLAACSSTKPLVAPPCPEGEGAALNAEGPAPVVWDNAHWTFLRFSGHQSFPKVTALRPDGNERDVSSSPNPDTGIITVHGVFPTLVLREGERVACVKNNAFDPYGKRP
jgi:hypothetical protein